MTALLVHSVRSEWLKQKRSFTTWLVLGAAFFIPTLIAVVRLVRPAGLPEIYGAAGFWERLWTQSWESMSVFIMPLVIMLGASLIAQLEYRNNTWKQVHATPQPLAVIYIAKLLIILAMVAQLFIWFNIAIYLSAMLPPLVFSRVDAPSSPIPFGLFLRQNAAFFVDVLPIVGLQYLLALRFRNFMVPMGVGMVIWITALGALPWEYNYVIPYAHAVIDYTMTVQSRVSHALPAPMPLIASCYFAVFVVIGYVLYAYKGDKG
jgi:lantibiotic transport system permease protein